MTNLGRITIEDRLELDSNSIEKFGNVCFENSPIREIISIECGDKEDSIDLGQGVWYWDRNDFLKSVNKYLLENRMYLVEADYSDTRPQLGEYSIK